MIKKLRIGFDPNGVWDKVEFRNIIRAFLVDSDKVEVYVLGTSITNAFITVATDMGINPNNIYELNSNAIVVSNLDALKVKIFLSSNNSLIGLINNDSIDTVGIVVNDITDNNKYQMKYVSRLQFWIDTIDRIENGIQENC